MFPYSQIALTTAFLQQSMQDCQEDYKRSLRNTSFPHWDAVIITASNKQQALGYQKQIDYRHSEGLLPPFTEFIIVPDKENKRVGSAGSTLSVLRELKNRYDSFEGKRFLCIHAGEIFSYNTHCVLSSTVLRAAPHFVFSRIIV